MKTAAFFLSAFMSLSLSAKAQSDVFSSDTVMHTSENVAQYFMNSTPDVGADSYVGGKKRNSRIWTRGVFYEGLLNIYREKQRTDWLQYAIDWGEFHQWQTCSDSQLHNADFLCCGQSYIDLYLMDETKSERLAHVKQRIDELMETNDQADWYWIDAIQMAMPIYARLGSITGNTDYWERMYTKYTYTRNQHGGSKKGGGSPLFNTETGLWYRDYQYDPPYKDLTETDKDCYWSRGNGWVYMALARVMQFTPDTEAHRAEYVADFVAMSQGLLNCQRADGSWNVSLAAPTNYGEAGSEGPEMTGTSLFVGGMAWGIRTGLLDEATYLPAVKKGWQAMRRAVHDDTGFVGYMQGTGAKPEDGGVITYNSVPNFEDFGIGCWLWGAAEVHALCKQLEQAQVAEPAGSHEWSGLVGFANYNDMRNGITGGYGGSVVRVNNRTDFARYIGDNIPRVVILEGKLEGTGVNRKKDIISVGSNKTIVGAGADATLYGIGLDINGKENIIIRNLTIFDADPDAIACRDAHHVWVDHCDLSSEHDNTKEDWDGLLDFTIGSSYLTASWNKFHDHDKVSVCNSGTMHYEDNGKIRLTYHHNAFQRTTQRNPRVGYGLGHVFNNYYEDISSYCIGTHTQAKVLSENNYFSKNANKPFNQMYSATAHDASHGEIGEVGSYFGKALDSSPLNQPTGTSFVPSQYYQYAHLLDVASALPSVVAEYAGPKEGLEKEAILWPGNGASDISCDAQLLWGPLENVKETKVWIGETPATLTYNAEASSNGATPGRMVLQPATTYYWKVQTVFEDNSSYFTPMYSFTTAAEVASKPYPADGETNAPLHEAVEEKKACGPMTLRWRPAFDAKEYRVYVSEPNGSEAVLSVGSTSATFINPGYLNYGADYVWRVDVVTSDGRELKGDEWHFSSPAALMNEGKTEAEDMARSAYVYKEYSDGSWYQSSGNYATVGEAGPGSLTGIWNGPDATCTLSLTYWNETSGAAGFFMFVNNQLLESWNGDKKSYAMVTHDASQQVSLKTGDEIRADFYVDGKMRCRIDYLNVKIESVSDGINELLAPVHSQMDAPVYDLTGRRVEVMKQGGMYIRGGKKFICR